MPINPKLLQAVKNFSQDPSLCNWLQLFSIETWERIKFSRTRKGLKIFETTITQNLLFELTRTQEVINSMMGRYFWNIRMYESENEKANGNDIELYVPFKNGLLFFPVQAKIIYHQGFKSKHNMSDGNYPPMNHLVKTYGTQQIDSLLRYAKSKNGYPLYLLYNYVNDKFKPGLKCNIPFEIEQFGCSITSANFIYKNFYKKGVWQIPTFSQIHPHNAHPWFVLACCFPKVKEVKDLASTYFPFDNDFPTDDLKIYSSAEINQGIGWKNFDLNEAQKGGENQGFNESQIDFIPKFRVILELESINPKFQQRR